jgi:site-specific DNA-methyltransferase (adenine-specific)
MKVRPDNPPGLKDKDLLGIPWRLALALQDNGWFLRSDIVWHKPNVMPESVKDRPTRAHEYLFMLTKSEHYRYDHEAVKEPAENGRTRNCRTVWNINTSNSGSSHVAAFPQALVEPCILASTKPGEFVLDPFFGSGTVGLVAKRLGRRYVGIELNPSYVAEAASALQRPATAPLRNGYRGVKPEYELGPALLETSGDDGHGAGSVSPPVSPTGVVADDQRTGTRYTERRTRRLRARH